MAQLVSAPPCHGGGRGFKSRQGRFIRRGIRAFRPGSSVGTSVRLKSGRSPVRSRPWPLQRRFSPRRSRSLDAIAASSTVLGRPLRGSSASPGSPNPANRSRHLITVGRETPTCRAATRGAGTVGRREHDPIRRDMTGRHRVWLRSAGRGGVHGGGPRIRRVVAARTARSGAHRRRCRFWRCTGCASWSTSSAMARKSVLNPQRHAVQRLAQEVECHSVWRPHRRPVPSLVLWDADSVKCRLQPVAGRDGFEGIGVEQARGSRQNRCVTSKRAIGRPGPPPRRTATPVSRLVR